MKILVVSHTYCAPINREKWKVLSQLYPEDQLLVIFPRHWPTHLFTYDIAHEDQDNIPGCTFQAFTVRCAGNEVLYTYKMRDLYRVLSSFCPDIIHVEQGDNALCYFQIIALKKLLRLSARIVFFTWINWHVYTSLKYRCSLGLIERFNRNNSAGAVVGNQDAQGILEQKQFNKPILVLPQLGVNNELFAPAAQQQKADGGTIGFLGRFVAEKGIELLLQAFAQLHPHFPLWRLVLVGKGPLRAELEKLVEHYGLSDSVSFGFPVTHHQMPALLNTLDIMVLPSYDTPEWKEQFGHIIIEAMACHVPVIGSSAGEIPHVIADAGLVFEQKNVHSLATCLHALMSDRHERLRLGKKGAERVAHFYSHQAIAHATRTFWSSILS